MDNFHYWNNFNKEKKTALEINNPKAAKVEDRFHNNHSSHSDSGLMTVVVTTDEPGLEVQDQSTGKWIALEMLLHQYVKNLEGPYPHRKYATIFWGDR
jgi:isopenicillin N synthase-like dioxygenase